MKIVIEPHKPAYDAVRKMLDKAGVSAQDALKDAANDIAKYLKEELHSVVKGTYSIKSSQFKKADIIRKNATKTRPTAMITVKGYTPSLYESYKFYKNTKHKAVRAMIKKAGGKKDVQLSGGSHKAFVATMSNGHTGIFQRKPGTRMKKGTRSQEKIKQINAMSKSKAAEMVFREQLQEDTEERLNLMLLKHMNLALGGK